MKIYTTKKNTTLFTRKKRAKPKVSKKKEKRKKLYTQKTQLFCKEEESQTQSK
jgi:hypothetical protein